MIIPRPPRSARLLAAALVTGTLLTTAACSDGDSGDTAAPDVTASPLAQRAGTPSATGTDAPVTDAQAKAALITEADIEDDWTQQNDAASWRDSLLIGTVDTADFLTAKTDAQDCQRLLDSLYDDDLLGKPSGGSALTGFSEGDSRLLYQVAAYRKSGLDDSMDWLRSLPDECDQFTATGDDGGDRTVQVVEASLPRVGDARQGLTVTVRGTTNGSPVTLTLDIAAVQVGTNAITVTNGGLDGADHDSTEQAVQQGTPRLKDVLAGKTPTPQPSEIE